MTAAAAVSSSGVGGAPHRARRYGKITHQPRARITRRELQLLVLAANGNTNERIAHYLDISAYTVNETLRRVYLKLGAVDRANAVAIALVRGVIKSSDIAGVRDPGGMASVHANTA